MVPIIAAPLAGYHDPPNAAIMTSLDVRHMIYPFISSEGIVKRLPYRNEVSSKLVAWRKFRDGFELHVQIFGRDPLIMSEAASFLEKEAGVDIIDINMGCSVKKIWKSGSGSLLLKEPELALDIIESIRKKIEIPLTIKTRTGWDSKDENGLLIIGKCDETGVDAVTLHPRTGKEQFNGKADWSKIRKAVSMTKIPVIGNGDIKTPFDTKRMLDETGARGVMIGRASIGNPWIFREVQKFLKTGNIIEKPSPSERIEICLRHIRENVDFKGLKTGLKEVRKHMGRYMKGLPNAVEIRGEIITCENYEQVKMILTQYKEYLETRAIMSEN